jgi:hypothetical protein
MTRRGSCRARRAGERVARRPGVSPCGSGTSPSSTSCRLVAATTSRITRLLNRLWSRRVPLHRGVHDPIAPLSTDDTCVFVRMLLASLQRKVERWIGMRRVSCRIGGIRQGERRCAVGAGCGRNLGERNRRRSDHGARRHRFASRARPELRAGRQAGEHRTVDSPRSCSIAAKE